MRAQHHKFVRPLAPANFAYHVPGFESAPPILLGIARSAHTAMPFFSSRAIRSPSSRATITCGILSISPCTEFACRYKIPCSRVEINAMALAFPFTARSITPAHAHIRQKDRPTSRAPCCPPARFFLPRFPPAQTRQPTPSPQTRPAHASPPPTPVPTPPTHFHAEAGARIQRRGHLRRALGPGVLDGEFFCVNTVRARVFEGGQSPIHSLLKCQSSRHAPAHFIGQLPQVAFRCGEGLSASAIRRSVSILRSASLSTAKAVTAKQRKRSSPKIRIMRQH